MKDPRAENCRRFAVENGQVTGVNLTYLPAPTAKYELVKANLVDQETARGQTVATVTVLDRANLPAQVQCYLAWHGTVGDTPHASKTPFCLATATSPTSTWLPVYTTPTPTTTPTGAGPPAIFIGDRDGNVLSDVIGGLGLPGARHVGYQLMFRERGEEAQDPGDELGEDGDSPPPAGDLAAELQRIEAKLDRLAKHLGVEV